MWRNCDFELAALVETGIEKWEKEGECECECECASESNGIEFKIIILRYVIALLLIKIKTSRRTKYISNK
jgi:hypothetical protein